MTYETKDFSSLLGMDGFSDELLNDHFELYEGYVSKTNELLEDLRRLARSEKLDSNEFAELKRRLGWEFDGMRLHELYFSNLGGGGEAPSGDIVKELKEQFRDFDSWQREFQAVGAMRGVGWAILYRDPVGERLMNLWIDEHDANHAVGCTPLLVMDVWEHAFATDYGTDRDSYIDAFMRNVNWSAVESRFQASTSLASVA